ncbi:DUF6492 family protein [Microbacterium sp. zg.Y625]|uniref:DUF6492 family protein n=1 Tax=Microbacterium jiangjiandongii TaxID=3049071 RepID=UPI00214BFEE0|nr:MULTISPECIES: DUF6492 family protein [unclassified Microbacterium]MCR2793563.1 DUF6492 family protein [Microbacterium sp. zg.Y625]WIM25917.1 DUF6492 family protein [Microbacterium sp. zg-Y625]
MADQSPRTLEILTPSYAPDFELCRDLVESVQRFAPPGTLHRIVVPAHDHRLFAELAGDNVTVQTVGHLLPTRMRKVPRANAWIDVRHPWPPVRGWIAQQVVKLGAAAGSTADRVLLVDSDIVFIRPFSIADYGAGGGIPLYRLPSGVHEGMTRHVIWDTVARRMLGLPLPARGGDARLPDYICCPCIWDPAVVRALLAWVQERAGIPWQAAIGRNLHFSEMVLYGVYVDEIVSAYTPVMHQTAMRCVNHYDENPLDDEAFARLLGAASEEDVAVMVSAKSGTDLATRRRAIAAFLGD